MKLIMLKPGRYWRCGLPILFELRDGLQRTPLSEAQGTVVLAFLGRPYLTRMDIAEALWENADDMPDFWHNSFHQRVLKLNRKLARFGHRIVWGQAVYRLEETVPERMAA